MKCCTKKKKRPRKKKRKKKKRNKTVKNKTTFEIRDTGVSHPSRENHMSVNQNLVPIVIEKSGRTERAYDIYYRLLKDRIVFLGGPVDDATANIIVAQMLFLSNEDVKTDINFYINSPGGAITAGLAIYDPLQVLRR